eukprot:1508576-Pleurochrysis_carterae.AAC.1
MAILAIVGLRSASEFYLILGQRRMHANLLEPSSERAFLGFALATRESCRVVPFEIRFETFWMLQC